MAIAQFAHQLQLLPRDFPVLGSVVAQIGADRRQLWGRIGQSIAEAARLLCKWKSMDENWEFMQRNSLTHVVGDQIPHRGENLPCRNEIAHIVVQGTYFVVFDLEMEINILKI